MKSPLLAASAVANLVMLAVFAFRPALAPPAFRTVLERYLPFASAPAAPAKPAASKPAPKPGSASRQEFWNRLATDDYRTLIARLRDAGFPPDIIRQVVQAEVANRYEPRMLALQSYDPDVPFWRRGTSPLQDVKRREALTALQQERSRLLRDLFKEGQIEPTTSITRPAWAANLSNQQFDLVQRISEDYGEMMSSARAAMTGGVTLPEDREKLAYLEREKRNDLASVLSPAQLADYEFQTSPLTRNIGSRLNNFDPTDAEFHTLYDAYTALSQKYPAGLQGMSQADRQAMTTQITDTLRSSLGEARYTEFLRETNSDFQMLTRIAQQEKLPASAAVQAYNLRDTTEREANRIFDDPALSIDEKRAAFKQLAQSVRDQYNVTLGPTAGATYASTNGSWISNLENGAIVTTSKAPFIILVSGSSTSSTSGGTSSIRQLPQSPKR